MLISLRACVRVCVCVLRDEFDKLQLNSCVITNAQKVIRALGSGCALITHTPGRPAADMGKWTAFAGARTRCMPHRAAHIMGHISNRIRGI